MTNQSKGRVGVAPSLAYGVERCKRCNAPYVDTDYCCDPQCPYNGPEEGVADALAPWYRAIARWALDDSRQS